VTLRVERIVWLPAIVDKLIAKHHVLPEEAEDILFTRPYLRRIERGYRPGEDVYAAMGQTAAGRFLIVFFVYKQTREALIVSARDMDVRERRAYERR
jgi:uncharacterized DUF497 family protein